MLAQLMRVASLLPAATEIVCAVGAREHLVGVSHECDYPPGVEALAVLTRPRRSLPRASAGIDRTVRELVAQALAVYEVLLEPLRAAAPDVLVTQALCDVCAVSLDGVRAALAELSRTDVEIVSLEPQRLGDVWHDVRRVGAALGRGDRGEHVAAELESRVRELAARTDSAGARPAVLTIEWLDPVMVGGTWMPELVEVAGGVALVTEPGQHAPTLAREELEALDPDVVLVKPCGFDLPRVLEERELLRERLPWSSWRAARDGQVFLADGNAFFNRPGPRLVESAEILAACLAPHRCPDLVAKHAASVLRVTSDLATHPLGS
jgi:iron complex transport system substrate-binding protein